MDKRHICLFACVGLPVLLILAIFPVSGFYGKVGYFVLIVADVVFLGLQIHWTSFDSGLAKRPEQKPEVESFGVHEVMDVRTQVAEDQEYVLLRRRRVGQEKFPSLKKKNKKFVEVVAYDHP